LSPVVVGLIWRWILDRNGVLNAGLDAVGVEPVNWLLDRHFAFPPRGGHDLGASGLLTR
jgi:alpha-1,4-digalacturonate transport system permease protein